MVPFRSVFSPKSKMCNDVCRCSAFDRYPEAPFPKAFHCTRSLSALEMEIGYCSPALVCVQPFSRSRGCNRWPLSLRKRIFKLKNCSHSAATLDGCDGQNDNNAEPSRRSSIFISRSSSDTSIIIYYCPAAVVAVGAERVVSIHAEERCE